MEVSNTLSASKFNISTAILLHRAAHGTGDGAGKSFATVHEVGVSAEGRPEIQAGSLLGALSLESMLRTLSPGANGLRFLESKVLARSATTMVWWCPPTKARMFFKVSQVGSRLASRTGMAVQPGLVFAVSGGAWHVWAVEGADRPNERSRLFQAPYMNVGANGRICAGNAAIPDGAEVWNPGAWEKAWLGSFWTHPNVHVQSRLVKWRGGVSALWLSLLTRPRKEFPQKALVPLRSTVGSLIDSLARGIFPSD